MILAVSAPVFVRKTEFVPWAPKRSLENRRAGVIVDTLRLRKLFPTHCPPKIDNVDGLAKEESDMEFYEVVKRRRTVREFLDRPVPEEVIQRVLDAGLQAPCNAHLKSWQFILLRDLEKRDKAVVDWLKARDMKGNGEIERFVARFDEEELKKVYRRSLPRQQSMMLEAPELLLVCYRMKPLSEIRTLFELNPLASVWMCVENIMLALAAEGLYGCTYTPYAAEGLKEFLGVPAGYEIAAVIPFGYPKEPPGEGEPEKLDGRLRIDDWESPANGS